MLSNLILKEKWALALIFLAATFGIVFVSISALHYLAYSTWATGFSITVATITMAFICLYNKELAKEKQRMIDEIYDLNNKLSPMFLIPQLITDFKDKLTEAEFADLINKSARESSNCMPKVISIIKEIHDGIEKI